MKKYWFRGGVWGLVSAVIIAALCMLPPFSFLYIISDIAWMVLDRLDFISLILCKGICEGYDQFAHIAYMWPSFIILGIIGGLIYGKIKKS